MAGSVNKVILIGNLGRDPEIRAMQSGDRVANLAIATSERWKDKSTGEQREKTEWHRVVVFNQGLINVAENYLKKGSKVYLEGQLETRKWTDQSGVEKYSTEIVLRPYRGELTMLDSRSGANDGFAGSPPGGYADSQPMQQQAAAAGGQGGGGFQPPPASDMDDEIPF